ncbi:hypothetical protein [Nocardia carnea]|uniref:Uncharacterized protein n=1 Tax=Nocardia carnea TaxID=37328 RepID=A0ABW7TJJ8_9NOCA|nr:hypothetical protein [Nocardia carnea]
MPRGAGDTSGVPELLASEEGIGVRAARRQRIGTFEQYLGSPHPAGWKPRNPADAASHRAEPPLGWDPTRPSGRYLFEWTGDVS